MAAGCGVNALSSWFFKVFQKVTDKAPPAGEGGTLKAIYSPLLEERKARNRRQPGDPQVERDCGHWRSDSTEPECSSEHNSTIDLAFGLILSDLQCAHVSSDFLTVAVTSTMERKMNDNVVMGWATMLYPIYRSASVVTISHLEN
ncbi:Forkhead Box Protein J2 [Manis pentadactyla]|nr:Forkhead Box Protein J2 [Manis pentadactyla]